MLGAIRKLFELVGLIAKEPGGAEKVQQVRRDARKALFWLVVTELLEIVQIYPLKYFIDGIIQGRSLGYLLGIVGIMLAIDVVVRTVANTMNHARHVAAWHQYVMLLGFGQAKQMSMDVAWHLEHGTGEKESLIAKNLNRIDNLTDRVIYNGLPVVIRIVLTIVALLIMEPVFAVFGLVVVGMFVAVMTYNSRYIAPLDEAANIGNNTHQFKLKLDLLSFLGQGVNSINLSTENLTHTGAGQEALSLKVISNFKNAISPF